MAKFLEHESKLPIIVASDDGTVIQVCSHCGRDIQTVEATEGEGICEKCAKLVKELVIASREHGFHFGF
jgi:hypothetical protein